MVTMKGSSFLFGIGPHSLPYPAYLCHYPDPEDPTSTTLELDELWSFVLKKGHDSWIWIALCRKTRQVVAYAVGDRSKKTCQCLWEAIPDSYRTGHCFTDFWVTYQAVIRCRSSTQQWGKRREKPLTWSAGITPCGNGSPVLSA